MELSSVALTVCVMVAFTTEFTVQQCPTGQLFRDSRCWVAARPDPIPMEQMGYQATYITTGAQVASLVQIAKDLGLTGSGEGPGVWLPYQRDVEAPLSMPETPRMAIRSDKNIYKSVR